MLVQAHRTNQTNDKLSFFCVLTNIVQCAWHKQWPGWMLSPSITLIAEKDTGKWNVSPFLVSTFNTIKGRQTAENPVSSQHQSPALGASGIESSIKAQECIHKTNRGKQQSRSLHKGILSLLICRSHLSPPKATLLALLCLEVLTFPAILSSKYRIGLKLQRWGGSVKQRNNLHLTGIIQSSGLSKQS